MYPVFGIRGATYFLGVAESLFGGLLFLSFGTNIWEFSELSAFITTVTIIPFMPDGWAAFAGGFPAMTEKVAFLMKDLQCPRWRLAGMNADFRVRDSLKRVEHGRPNHNCRYRSFTGIVALRKGNVLLAASFYLLKQDVMSVSLAAARPVSDRWSRLAANVDAELHEQVQKID